MTVAIRATELVKSYTPGTRALDAVSLEVASGEVLVVMGPSGSGKSTLLHILGGLAEPTTGKVVVNGQDINALGQADQGTLRNQALGFVYQFHHLLPEFTALENVAMPLLIRRMVPADALARAREILEKTGLANRLEHKPGELSGGERQRAAIARAMVTRPRCIMADEPTGNLDSSTAQSIHDLMMELNREFNTSLVVVTHDMGLAEKIGQIVRIEDGVLKS